MDWGFMLIILRIMGLVILAMVYFAAQNKGIKDISKKVKGSIAKSLGLKGRAKYLKTSLDTTLIENFDSYSDKAHDAIYAGWSKLD